MKIHSIKGTKYYDLDDSYVYLRNIKSTLTGELTTLKFRSVQIWQDSISPQNTICQLNETDTGKFLLVDNKNFEYVLFESFDLVIEYVINDLNNNTNYLRLSEVLGIEESRYVESI